MNFNSLESTSNKMTTAAGAAPGTQQGKRKRESDDRDKHIPVNMSERGTVNTRRGANGGAAGGTTATNDNKTNTTITTTNNKAAPQSGENSGRFVWKRNV